MTFQTNFKPSRTARKKAEKKVKGERRNHERVQMTAARKRDRVCRFPLCGCRKLQLQTEVAHAVQHRGMGGNPSGDRTTTDKLVLLCTHRHQFGAISLHKGTLRALPMTTAGFDGPVEWQVDLGEVGQPSDWVEVARETSVQHIEPLTPRQAGLLRLLAEMDL